MFVGIDIGGTFTDIVAVDEQAIIYQHKVPSTANVLTCVLEALDWLLKNVDKRDITQLCISTTLITNTIVKNQLPSTSLILMPGPGVNIRNSFPVKPIVIKGYINHIGKLVTPPNLETVAKLDLEKYLAISGKVSVRNPENELSVEKYLTKKYPDKTIVTAGSLSGKLNFIRRTNTAYYAAATQNIFCNFSQKIIQAMQVRDIKAPVSILKADAGRVDIVHAHTNTAEFIFTGPAASVLGIKALLHPQGQAIALDIGGTTTDISFWRDGQAILNNKGAQINGFNTSINTFYLHSLPLGGNSIINRCPKAANSDNPHGIIIGPQVSTNCIYTGGDILTLSDILLVLDKVQFADKNLILDYLQAQNLSIQFAQEVFELALSILTLKLQKLIAEINRTPVYTVSDLTKPVIFAPNLLIGVGGAAPGIIPDLADITNLEYIIPTFAPVANALGAALAKPTLTANIQVNTMSGFYTLSQEQKQHPATKNLTMADAKSILLEHLKKLAQDININFTPEQAEIVECEEYPVLVGYRESGTIINITMQIKPDILSEHIL